MILASIPGWLGPAIVVAAITSAVTLLTLVVNGRRNRTDRQRGLFSSALGDVVRYSEFAYIVRRRRQDIPEEERRRISTELSDIQSRLDCNRAVLEIEAPRVGRAYATLVEETRRVAGSAIRDGWNIAPIAKDSEVHVTDVDLSGIEQHRVSYQRAVADHLAISPWWLRAALRFIRHRLITAAKNPRGRTAAVVGRDSQDQDDEPKVA